MNFKPANGLVFLIFGIAWVLLIVSFCTNWYRIDNSVGDTTYFFYNKIKIGDQTTPLEETSLNEKFVGIFKASLALAVLAWATLSSTLLFIILSFVGILKKIPLPLPIITKIILPVIALSFCILSMFIFVILGDARYKDCVANLNGDSFDCNQDDIKRFVYDNEKGQGGPTTGWIAVLISTSLVLIGGIISILFAEYNDDGTTTTAMYALPNYNYNYNYILVHNNE
ncbi:hypothetical protein DFA_00309 [Cavenderia fasciculata]|uniref:Transmembrane protein n=1 Tax=Cavenderia fasciculata TaxID=261658 RepID=F4PY71_CACFS|nr:uncharacterized protein DFA_00309 [Cavenderia fasciculata]EGG19731.1 hypothetical protein DFA_00309 [Cavenderia fasciculata]|eukprot:XP_004358025.1 hypothetical protein DFA_00309 [Cavenderia fasciculata]